MTELVQPAIQLAKEGFIVNDFTEMVLKLVGPAVCSHPSGKALFQPNGAYPKSGELFKMPELADCMEYLAQYGSDEFYRGEIARQVAETHQNQGGYLTREDFENYRVIERNPLMIPYRDYQICTNPPPSAGGTLASFTLKLMEKYNIGQFRFGSTQHMNVLIKAMKETALARGKRLNQYIQHPDVLKYFFDTDFLHAHEQRIREQPLKLGSTTHFTVADAAHNIVSITASTGEGSGYVPNGTGIMFNNMLGEEDLNPNGFHEWGTNQRMTSMMAPTLLFKDDKPVLATGSGRRKQNPICHHADHL